MDQLLHNDTLLDLIIAEMLAQGGLLECRAVSKRWLGATIRVFGLVYSKAMTVLISPKRAIGDIPPGTCLWDILSSKRMVWWCSEYVNISIKTSDPCHSHRHICYTCGFERWANSAIYTPDGEQINAHVGAVIFIGKSLSQYVFTIENYTIDEDGRDSFTLVNCDDYCTDHYTGPYNEFIQTILFISLRGTFGKSLIDVRIAGGFNCGR